MKPGILLLLLLLLLVALAGLTMTMRVRALPPAANTDGGVTATTFADGFLAHLGKVQAAVDALLDLGERRERNLLVVGQRQSAMNAALDSMDAWLAQQAAHQDDPAVAAYRSGADYIRRAMADAQSAFLRFDWAGIAKANGTLEQGAEKIAEAEEWLRSPDGS